jgi:hypothetical protein
MSRHLVSLLESGRADEAVARLMSSFPNTPDGFFKMYNTLSYARQCFLKNEENRRPGYLQELQSLVDVAEGEDKAKLEKLLVSPLAFQRRLFKQPNVTFDSDEVEERFQKLDPCPADFDRFKLPSHVFEIYKREKERRRTERIMKRPEPLTPSVVNDILAKAKEVAVKEIKAAGDYYAAITAIGLLSGRRNFEVVSTLRWEEVPSFPYQARVTGILKKGVTAFIDGAEEEFTIPLLCPFELFDTAMGNIRAFRDVGGVSSDIEGETAKVGIRRASIKVFGEALGHTKRRGLYGNLVWEQRKINKFRPDVSKDAFIKLALCHVLSFPDTTTGYTAAVELASESEESEESEEDVDQRPGSQENRPVARFAFI